MVNCFIAIVHGRVQGVGFRYFTQNKAISLKITGSVQNLEDETVKIEAFGPKSNLEQFLHYIKIGSIGSQVEQVDIQWLQMETIPKKFEIRG